MLAKFSSRRRWPLGTLVAAIASFGLTHLCLAQSVSAADETVAPHRTLACARAFGTMAKQIRSNDFINHRTLAEARELFPELEVRIATYGPRLRLLDSGTGDAFVALNYFADTPAARQGHVTAVTVQPTSRALMNKQAIAASSSAARFKFLANGEYIEDIAAEILGEQNIVLDLFGAFTWSEHFEAVLNKYHELAQINAHGAPDAWLLLRTPRHTALVQTSEGEVDWLDWIQRFPGSPELLVQRSGFMGTRSVVLRVRDAAWRLPELELVETRPGENSSSPRVRVYRVAGELR